MNTWNMSVKAKLFATLALTGIVMIVVGVIGLGGTKSTNADLDAIFSNRFMPTGWVGTIESSERAVLEKVERVTSTCVSSVVEGDRVAIHWVFDFVFKSGKTARFDEVALQEWRGDRVWRERFFYDTGNPAA